MPTDQSKVINFKVPTVQVCIDYADLPTDVEQEVATSYLDRLNEGYDSSDPLTSSLYWTSQDRKAALYWIFLYITEDTVKTMSYECSCGEVHQVDFDLQDVADQVVVGNLARSPVLTMGSGLEYRIVPLRGWSDLHLEEMRLQLDTEATKEELADLKVMRTLLQFHPLDVTNKSPNEIIEYLVGLKETLTIKEYRSISSEIQSYNESNTFGLPLHVNAVGEPVIITPAFPCTNENKEVSATINTRLSVPFRSYEYITTL
jgi:hypothetical protein